MAESTGEQAAEAKEPQAAEQAAEIDWEAIFSHKGPFEKEKFGPAPDYSNESAWYWYGQDGKTCAELAPESSERPPVKERPADLFYIHPTSYFGEKWNMPLAESESKAAQALARFQVATEASAFNGSCRVYCPKFRQMTVAAVAYPDEGRQAAAFAYADVKAAFEHYLKERNDGRPIVLASHSQGSFHMMRLIQEFVEGKPLFQQVVAIYCIAAWAPLSMFEGKDAVFKDIKVSKAADSTGCLISYVLESKDNVVKHREAGCKGDWYPAIGHWRAGEWISIDGNKIVGTNPLTWSSNGMSASKPECNWLGMLDIFKELSTENGPVKGWDTMQGLQMSSKDIGLKIDSVGTVKPDEVQAMLTDQGLGDFSVKTDDKTGDVEVVLPKEMGTTDYGYEHMDYILFWFNIRENVRVRVAAFQAKQSKECPAKPPKSGTDDSSEKVGAKCSIL